jgi:hypothetical protein
MKLHPRKGGHGHITSYMAIIGSAEARRAGFIDNAGESVELEKLVDEAAHTITIRIRPLVSIHAKAREGGKVIGKIPPDGVIL